MEYLAIHLDPAVFGTLSAALIVLALWIVTAFITGMVRWAILLFRPRRRLGQCRANRTR
jgi:hypothetical protein